MPRFFGVAWDSDMPDNQLTYRAIAVTTLDALLEAHRFQLPFGLMDDGRRRL
jgi:hypothetical protein